MLLPGWLARRLKATRDHEDRVSEREGKAEAVVRRADAATLRADRLAAEMERMGKALR